jgi:hypothetical protein
MTPRMMTPCVAGWLALAFFIAIEDMAAAASLSWEQTGACPAEDNGRFAIERALLQPLSRAAPARIDVVLGAEAPRGYRAHLRLSRHTTASTSTSSAVVVEREFFADNCWDLVDAIAAVVAVAIGGNVASVGGAEASHEPHAIASQQRSQWPAPRDELSLDAPAQTTTAGLRAGVSASFIADLGTLPGAALGAELGIAARAAAFELRLTAALLAPQDLPLDGRDRGVRLGAMLLGAVACWEPWVRDQMRTAICAGWELSRWSGAAATEDSGWWTGPRAELGWSWAPAAVQMARLRVRVGTVAPLTRPTLQVRDSLGIQEAYQLSPFLGRVWTGVEVQLP